MKPPATTTLAASDKSHDSPSVHYFNTLLLYIYNYYMSRVEVIANTLYVSLCVDVCSRDVIYASVMLTFGYRRGIPWLGSRPFDQAVH